jgi:hypothetical protein
MSDRIPLVGGATAGLLLVVLSACDLELTSRLRQHAEIAGVVLLAEESEDPAELVIQPGGPHPVSVQFVDAKGRPITSLGSEHRTQLNWEPAGSVTSQPEPDDPFTYHVSIPRACAPPQLAFVGYGHDARANERVFGPVPVVVSPRIGTARAFGADGVEFAPPVRLPSMEPLLLEIRYYDCEGLLVTGLEEDYEVLLFFSTVEFASWGAVAGAGFQAEVVVNEQPGSSGQIGFGIRRKGAAGSLFFGPFPLIVY